MVQAFPKPIVENEVFSLFLVLIPVRSKLNLPTRCCSLRLRAWYASVRHLNDFG